MLDISRILLKQLTKKQDKVRGTAKAYERIMKQKQLTEKRRMKL